MAMAIYLMKLSTFMKTYKKLIYQEKSSAFVVQETRFMMIFVNRWTTSKQSLLKLGQKKAPTALKLI